MSRPDEWITVELTPERAELAKRRAVEQLEKYPADRGNFTTYTGIPREVRIECSQMAQEAIAQHLGLTSIPADVKPQWAPQSPEDAYLKIPPNDCATRPDMRWVLVTGRGSTFTLLGGIRAREATTLGRWRDTKVARAAYYVEPSRLHAGLR